MMANAVRKQSRQLGRSTRRGSGSPGRKTRRPPRPPRITTALEVEFEALVTAIVADVAAHVRLREWDWLAKLLKFYNRNLGTKNAYWLHVAVFREAVNQVQTSADPAEVARWAELALAAHQFVNDDQMTIRDTISILKLNALESAAYGRFFQMDGTTEAVN